MLTSDLIHQLVKQIGSKRANTFFLNGPPGSGKSFLLNQLAQELPNVISHVQAFGPYRVSAFNDLNTKLVDDFKDFAYVQDQPQRDVLLDLVSTWNWLKHNLQASSRLTLVVLIDLDYQNMVDLDIWRSWFSSIRYLEDVWEDGPTHLLVLLSGYWQHNTLETFYQDINLSFPYTVGKNYFIWSGISVEQTEKLVTKRFPDTSSATLFGSLLHEITDGHPGAVQDILESVKDSSLSSNAIMSSAKQAARDGGYASRLVEIWVSLPEIARSAIGDLLLFRQIPTNVASPYLDYLRTAGIVKLEKIGEQYYAVSRSWYLDMVARNHLDNLGISDHMIAMVNPNELIPKLANFNLEAYRLINQIENLARNFVATQLCLQHRNRSTHILDGKVFRPSNFKNREEDALERAKDWKQRNQDRSANVDINPLIAFISTSDLSRLLTELAEQLESPIWKLIANVIDDLSGVRDAVMHNQLIDDIALQRLYNLQAEIFQAMSLSINDD